MSEKEIIKFSVAEIAGALMKERGIHKGKWLLVFGFSRANVYTGPTEEEVRQTVAISIGGARLIEAKDNSNLPGHLIYDAEVINPNVVASRAPKRTPRGRPKPKQNVVE